MRPASRLTLFVVLALLLTVATPARGQLPRTLVATFQTSGDVDEAFGYEISERIREWVEEEADLLTHVDEDRVGDLLDRAELDRTNMDLLTWRLVGSRTDAGIVVFGEISSIEGGENRVQAVIVETDGGERLEVPSFTVMGDGGDAADTAAGELQSALERFLSYHFARLNCREYLSADQYRDAVRNCEEALQIYPSSKGTLYLRGQVALEQEKWSEAVEYLSRAVEQDSSYDRALQSLAYSHAKAGSGDQALQLYRHYMEFNPDNVDVRLSVAYNLATADQLDAAQAIVQDGLERAPGNKDLQKYLDDLKQVQARRAGEPPSDSGAALQWTGSGDKSTRPFAVSKPGWRVQWVVRGDEMSTIRVYVKDLETGKTVTSASSDGPGADQTYVYATGRFYIRVISANAEWVVRVQKSPTE